MIFINYIHNISFDQVANLGSEKTLYLHLLQPTTSLLEWKSNTNKDDHFIRHIKHCLAFFGTFFLCRLRLFVQINDFGMAIKVINFISCNYSPDQILKIKLRLLQTYFREKAIFQFCPQQHQGKNDWIYLFIFCSDPPADFHVDRVYCC